MDARIGVRGSEFVEVTVTVQGPGDSATGPVGGIVRRVRSVAVTVIFNFVESWQTPDAFSVAPDVVREAELVNQHKRDVADVEPLPNGPTFARAGTAIPATATIASPTLMNRATCALFASEAGDSF